MRSEKLSSEFESQEKGERRSLPTRIIPIEESSLCRSDFDYELSTMQTEEEKRRFLSALEAAREIGEERKRFWNMLVTEVAKTDYQPPQDRQAQILDVGCGKCKEGIVLSAYFGGGEFGSANDNVKLIGIDINKRDIDKAISGHQRTDFSQQVTRYVLPSNFEFIHGDATKLDQYPQIPDQLDVIVIRHQRILDNEEIWTEIFQESLNRLSPDGIMILTSFSDVEHQMLMEKLKELNVEVKIDETNPYAKPTLHEEVSTDRNITIIKRKK